MPVEIRELVIKGIVLGNSSIKKNFQQYNSPLVNTVFVERLKKDIINECVETVFEKLDRKKYR